MPTTSAASRPSRRPIKKVASTCLSRFELRMNVRPIAHRPRSPRAGEGSLTFQRLAGGSPPGKPCSTERHDRAARRRRASPTAEGGAESAASPSNKVRRRRVGLADRRRWPSGDRMHTLLLHIVPIAIALAFSTVPILAALVILLSPFGSRSAVPFLIGWIGGIFGVALLMTALAQFLPDSRIPRRAERTIGWLEITVGAALILLGVWTILRSRRRSQQTIPKWMTSIEKLGP